MSYNNEFTGRREVYRSYTKEPKAIREVEKLIATLEAEGGEAAKPLIEKKQAEIYELEAKYDFAELVLSKMESDEEYQQRMVFEELVLTKLDQGMPLTHFELSKMDEDKDKDNVMTFQFTFHINGQRYYAEGTFYYSHKCWLGIILESNKPQNGKVIKGGSIVFGEEKDGGGIGSITDDKNKHIDAVLQTIDGEIVTICQTLYKI